MKCDSIIEATLYYVQESTLQQIVRVTDDHDLVGLTI